MDQIKKSSAKHRFSAKAAQSIPPSTWQMLRVSFGDVVKLISDVKLAIQRFNSQPASKHCKAMLPQTLRSSNHALVAILTVQLPCRICSFVAFD
jgi:hypothetical protein